MTRKIIVEPVICFLSGLEIPPGKQNKEHYCPKSRVPQFIWQSPANIHPAHKVINAIKSDRMPCEWEETKWNLAHHALHAWNLKQDDAYFVARTLQNWEKYVINPCEYCLMHCKGNQR